MGQMGCSDGEMGYRDGEDGIYGQEEMGCRDLKAIEE